MKSLLATVSLLAACLLSAQAQQPPATACITNVFITITDTNTSVAGTNFVTISVGDGVVISRSVCPPGPGRLQVGRLNWQCNTEVLCGGNGAHCNAGGSRPIYLEVNETQKLAYFTAASIICCDMNEEDDADSHRWCGVPPGCP